MCPIECLAGNVDSPRGAMWRSDGRDPCRHTSAQRLAPLSILCRHLLSAVFSDDAGDATVGNRGIETIRVTLFNG